MKCIEENPHQSSRFAEPTDPRKTCKKVKNGRDFRFLFGARSRWPDAQPALL